MVSPERLDALQKQWARLLEAWGVPPADAYPAFDALAAAYQEPHRRYHTLEHLAEVFRVVARLRPDPADAPAVQLAVWYHDAVYDPRSSTNEADSAALMHRTLGPLGVSEAVLTQAAGLIRATSHAATPANPAEVALVDADLAILGSSEVRYRRYAADVRQEYAHVPDRAFYAGRAAVLERFLARDAIYRHPLTHAEGEAAARANLARELAECQKFASAAAAAPSD